MLEAEGERKYVTVLFSDLSGYTAMSEKLDPEDLKEIMSRVFGEIAQVVTKYEGFIEKFVGDAVMALFGVLRLGRIYSKECYYCDSIVKFRQT